MARVTVEDCVKKIPNRFRLVLLSTERARELSSGALPTVARDNDKNPVIALREIAAGAVSVDALDLRLREEIRNQISGFTSKTTRDAELRRTMADEGTSFIKQGEGEVDIFAEIGKEREDRGDDDFDELDDEDEDDFDDEEEDDWDLEASPKKGTQKTAKKGAGKINNKAADTETELEAQ